MEHLLKRIRRGRPRDEQHPPAKLYTHIMCEDKPRESMRLAPVGGRFLDACRRRATDVRPVWFMRQAGRYLKPYRDIRAKHGILEICKKPELAASRHFTAGRNPGCGCRDHLCRYSSAR